MTVVTANGKNPSTFLTNGENVGAFSNSSGDVMTERDRRQDNGIFCNVSIGNRQDWGKILW